MTDSPQKNNKLISTLNYFHSEVKPHFVHNALDTIYWMAKNYEAEEISEMVLNLSKYLRLFEKNKSDFGNVEEIMENLRYYIFLQQTRFLIKSSIEFEIQDESRFVRIPLLLLQPLIENALLHGLKQCQKGGQLTIISMIKEGKLRLYIDDNGVGMSNNQFSSVVSDLQLIENNYLNDIPVLTVKSGGLCIVASLIFSIYRSDAQISIRSKLGEGTRISISLPLQY